MNSRDMNGLKCIKIHCIKEWRPLAIIQYNLIQCREEESEIQVRGNGGWTLLLSKYKLSHYNLVGEVEWVLYTHWWG